MNAIIPASFGAVSTRFAASQQQDDLSSGIQSSFGLIGYKGKVWSIRHRGAETPLMREDGDGPRGSIEVVILKASTQVSKIWYENGYVEGSNAAPDCFSNNGVTPDPTAAKKQCTSCAVCPHNQWGSRVTPAGKQGKSCSDSKRLAVVPNGDINNDAFGGPMLLRVPAASLQDLAAFGQKMQQMGYPYYSIVTKIGFDAAESFPKFTFSALRPLADNEADLVLSMRDGHQVNRILSDSEFATAAAPAAQQPVFEQQANGQQTNGFGTAATETPEQKAMREMQAEIARLQAAAAAPVETPEQKAMREMQAEMERLKKAAEDKAAADKAAAEAAAKAKAEADAKAAAEAAAAKAAQPVETPEQKAMREMQAEIARLQAAAGQATAPAVEPVTTVVTEVAQPVETVAAEPAKVAVADAPSSAFEANLDEMLEQLLQ